MATKSLKDMSNKELNEKVLNLSKETFNIRMKQYASGEVKTHLLSRNRKDIARIKTILNQRVKDESRD